MATQNDVRRIALALEGVTESPDDFRFFHGDAAPRHHAGLERGRSG